MSKHTPGPWMHDKIFALVIGPRREEIAALHSGTEEGRQNLETSNYNARLITAAPDMLEALYHALPFVEDRLYDQCFKPGKVKKYADAIRAAIAKAEGES